MVKKKKYKTKTFFRSRIYKTVDKIERRFNVDSIKLSDGTKLWNLIRVILHFYVKKDRRGTKKRISINTVFHVIKENIAPLNLPYKRIKFCGFSGTEARRFINGKFYDRNIDPLYDIFDKGFYVFEWPTPASRRRNYHGKIYSKNYVPMHIPIFSKTFFCISINKLFNQKKPRIIADDVLDECITFFSKKSGVEKDRLTDHIYESITVFYYLKKIFVKLLKKIQPKAVLMRCGYDRFHMALSQACKELNIPSIELQHGMIAKYSVGYIKETSSKNRDCVPEYLLTYGEIFRKIVIKSKLFASEKVVSVGFPYLEEIKHSPPTVDKNLEMFLSKFDNTILVTSQWSVAEEIKNFVIKTAEELKKITSKVGIIFKPHPRDEQNYDDMKQYKNVYLADKNDDIHAILAVVDIHSTVYSTSSLEALAFGKPNVFIDIGTDITSMFDIVDEKSSFIVSTSKEFVEKVEYILRDYNEVSNYAFQASQMFFKPNAKENIKRFLKSKGLI